MNDAVEFFNVSRYIGNQKLIDEIKKDLESKPEFKYCVLPMQGEEDIFCIEV